MPRGLPVGGGGGLDLTHTFKTHFFPGNLKKNQEMRKFQKMLGGQMLWHGSYTRSYLQIRYICDIIFNIIMREFI